jgi:predicted Ser/Thr protein kinase
MEVCHMAESIVALFNKQAEDFHSEYLTGRTVMTFSEYLEVFESDPRHHIRDAARYLLDAIDYFGAEKVERPWGEETRLKIFNQAFLSPDEQLVGQEATQVAIRKAVESQVRDGRVNRLILIYGPNGSAKSTTVRNLINGLVHYSQLDEGVLYRFRWIFPSRKTAKGTIGFGARLARDQIESFAHLEDDEIDATLECEVRDHPLLLIPKKERIAMMEAALERAGVADHQIPDHFLKETLCHRCRQVADALMRTHKGDIRKVLAHVQVERWTMSGRYRRGTVQVGPQMSTDAGQRQVTADRSLSSLPIELQNMTLFETFGPLVDGSGGIIEFEDMLKRPLDSFKYLLSTIETGDALLGQSILKLNTVLMGTTNDVMLEAFREHHEYPSFRDRLTLIPVPFITQRRTEQRIYELQLVPHVPRHVAPHAVAAAAHFAVLSRLLKPKEDAYPEELAGTIKELTAVQKAALYDSGIVPGGLSDDEAAELVNVISDMRQEHAASWQYEGRLGPSPRVIRQVLLRASLSDDFECLSPFAVLGELDDLCGRVKEHPFLEHEVDEGGYHDFRGFVRAAEAEVLDNIEQDIRSASGLVEESRYLELLHRYVSHVRYVVKGEKVTSETTGQDEDPDEAMMARVERMLGVVEDKTEFRKGVISRIAAWALENPRKKVRVDVVFPEYLKKIRDAYFLEHRKKVVKVAKCALTLLSDGAESLDAADRKAASQMLREMTGKHHYCDACARDGLARLISKRFNPE